MAITEEVVEQLKVKHPAAKSFRKLSTKMSDDTVLECVVKLPIPEAAYAMSREKMHEPSAQEKASANRILFNAGVVYPEGADLQQMIRDYPGIVDTWAGEIGELAGAIRGTLVEKL